MKSSSKAQAADTLRPACAYLNGFACFEIPKVAGVNNNVIRAVQRAVHKHQHVLSVELTPHKNLLVVPDERNLSKSSTSYGGFEEEIKQLIVDTVRHKLNPKVEKKAKPTYVVDETRRAPAPAPVAA